MPVSTQQRAAAARVGRTGASVSAAPTSFSPPVCPMRRRTRTVLRPATSGRACAQRRGYTAVPRETGASIRRGRGGFGREPADGGDDQPLRSGRSCGDRRHGPGRFPWPPPGRPKGDGPKRILFAGLTGEWMKGFHVLREACARLWARRQDFELAATSDPEEGAEPFIRFVGWQSQEELPKQLWASDVLAMPTVAQEALGR